MVLAGVRVRVRVRVRALELFQCPMLSPADRGPRACVWVRLRREGSGGVGGCTVRRGELREGRIRWRALFGGALLREPGGVFAVRYVRLDGAFALLRVRPEVARRTWQPC